MRLIDADALDVILDSYKGHDKDSFIACMSALIDSIKNAPTVDAVEVVRCEDCRWWCTDCMPKEFGWCDAKMNRSTSEDWFCADGERREMIYPQIDGITPCVVNVERREE